MEFFNFFLFLAIEGLTTLSRMESSKKVKNQEDILNDLTARRECKSLNI